MRLLSFVLLIAACSPPEVINSGRTRGEGEGEEGEGEEGEGEDCDEDADCPGGHVCEDDACVRVCSDASDCNGGQLCQDSRCVTPECIEDLDCPGGFFCDDNRCVGITSCDEGDSRCVDSDTQAVCTDGREVLEDCDDGFACDFGFCVPVAAEGEGEEGEGEEGEGEGEGEEGEGEGEGPCVQECFDDDTLRECFFGQEFFSNCAATERCVVDECVPAPCEPVCGNRECGPDPVCGESCGSCLDTCTEDGECVADPTPPGTARIQVSITPGDAGFDIYLSRTASGSFCDTDDSCFFGNCQEGSDIRPNWDGNANVVDGDPLMASGNPEVTTIVTPAAAQAYRIAVHNKRGNEAGSIQLNITVDGVVVFGASRVLQPGQLRTGMRANWTGSRVDVTRTDSIQSNFSCGGEACTVAGGECAAGFSCDEGNAFTAGAGCVQCLDSADCASGDECRQGYCVDDTADRGITGQCRTDVDCRDDLRCNSLNECNETCSLLLCAFGGAECCTATTPDGQCSFDGICE